MTIEEVVRDNELDARPDENGRKTATCPRCLSRGLLKLDLRRNTFECQNRACRITGDARMYDALVRRVRGMKRFR